MTLMPVIFVTDMHRSLAFYGALDDQFHVAFTSDTWSEIRVRDAILALHQAGELPVGGAERMKLQFLASGSLELLVERLEQEGIRPAGGIQQADFGRFIVITDPDGLQVQINQRKLEYGA